MELENPLITIIIPIYNREQTLERCLCSVLRQTYSHLEIITVDDGSTDHSRVILDKYQKKDSRLRVVRKENSGVSEKPEPGTAAGPRGIHTVCGCGRLDYTGRYGNPAEGHADRFGNGNHRLLPRHWQKNLDQGHIPASSLMTGRSLPDI